MENNITTKMPATQPSSVAPSSVVAVRLRAVATKRHAANAVALWTDAALTVANVRHYVVTSFRATPGPVAWSPPTC